MSHADDVRQYCTDNLIAKSFDIHPAIIMFPEYEAKEIEKAA